MFVTKNEIGLGGNAKLKVGKIHNTEV